MDIEFVMKKEVRSGVKRQKEGSEWVTIKAGLFDRLGYLYPVKEAFRNGPSVTAF